MFLDRLKPGGVLSVSRLYQRRSAAAVSRSRRTARSRSPPRCSRTAASKNPRDHILDLPRARRAFGVDAGDVLVSAASRSRSADIATIDGTAAQLEFTPRAHARRADRPDASPIWPRPAVPAGARRVRRRHLAAHRQPAVLLPDGRPRHVLRSATSRTTTTSPGRCWCWRMLAAHGARPGRGLHRVAAVPRRRTRPGDASAACRPFYMLLRRHRARLPAGRGLAAAAAQHLPRPSDLRPDGRAVLDARVQRHRQHAAPNAS